jgi:hypothetical protein
MDEPGVVQGAQSGGDLANQGDGSRHAKRASSIEPIRQRPS